MKIVFPIRRMNWYRVVATTIDAALAAGHEVECWHSTGGTHSTSNRPNRERVPSFKAGSPAILDYESDAAFLQLVNTRDPDAIVSISTPWSDDMCARFQNAGERPLWVLMITNDTLIRTSRQYRVTCNSLIVLRTKHEEDCLIRDHSTDMRAYLAQMELSPKLHGAQHLTTIRNRVEHPWTPAMLDHLRSHSVRTGYPLLDTAAAIDTAAVRARWGLPQEGPVIGCLSSPYGSVLNVPWEKAFASNTPWGRCYWNARWKGWRGALCPAPCERQVMQALKRFCETNHAPLVVKLRHTQDASPWMREVADVIIGEESYYPHSAVELAAVASVMFGFFSTGAPEAVAAGHPFVNLGIPGYNRQDWELSASMFIGMFEHPGVAWNIEAADWVRSGPSLPLDTFTLDPAAHAAYVKRYCGPMDGRHGARVIHALEQVAAGQRPCDIPCDENHIVRLPS